MTPRTRTTLLAGFAIFVVGTAGAAFLGTRSSGGSSGGPGTVRVHYATAPVPVATGGATALADGRIGTKSIGAADLPANAVTDPTQLSGRVSASAIPGGAIVTTDMFPAPQTRIGTVVIPPGKRALSLEVQPLAGVSGFAGAGDRIDVYGIATGEETPPRVRLVVQGVEVLNVNGVGLPAVQAQPGGPNLIYLLAVTPVDAERLIYLNEYEKLYFDLVPKGEGPVRTPGVGPADALGV